MANDGYLLAIDQGTTSSRAIIYDRAGRPVASAQAEFPQHYPQADWVEHDPEEIWTSVRQVVTDSIRAAGISADTIRAIGIANQRETTLVWERDGGRPIYNAIVWQDRRTVDVCNRWKADEHVLRERTGLVANPYFSVWKLQWILDNVEGARVRAERGELAFGTVDSFLIWRLTGGKAHVTDVTNASRTLLLNLHSGSWDGELCHMLRVPEAVLPEVLRSATIFGTTAGLDWLPDGIPIAGVAGDQQASLFGQGCWQFGEAKCTYGTGAFLLVHLGDRPVLSERGLLTTIAATLADQPLQYAVEGSLFIAGAAVQWLRDALGIIERSEQVNELAAQARADSEVVFVPALVGLGAPYWAPEAQGTIFGLTRATGAAELARAVLESIALQVLDLAEAIAHDTGQPLKGLRADGGAARSDLLMQLQADLLRVPVERAEHGESTALGAAMLAALGSEFVTDPQQLRAWASVERTFQPSADVARTQALVDRWKRAVQTVIEHYRS